MSDKHAIHPIATTGTPTRSELQAYVEGTSTPSQQHAIEVHLEDDPFLRDAVEGLREVGAFAALDQLTPPSIAPQSTGSTWVVAATLVVLTASVVAFSGSSGTQEKNKVSAAANPPVERTVVGSGTELYTELDPLQPAEIAALVQLAETLQIGHQKNDLHTKAMEHVVDVREPSFVDSMIAVDPILNMDRVPVKPAPLHAKKTSLQLMYLHDLKLVDPKELYAHTAMLAITDQGVDARFSDNDARDAAQQNQRLMPYTEYMETAMNKFAHNDHKGCLQDLQRVLDQYPNDVNALFYSGLCCYNLGSYQRAKRLLFAAATHSITVFNEEADWYHALTLDHTGDAEEAKAAMIRIAEQNGFYSERAKKELTKK